MLGSANRGVHIFHSLEAKVLTVCPSCPSGSGLPLVACPVVSVEEEKLCQAVRLKGASPALSSKLWVQPLMDVQRLPVCAELPLMNEHRPFIQVHSKRIQVCDFSFFFLHISVDPLLATMVEKSNIKQALK